MGLLSSKKSTTINETQVSNLSFGQEGIEGPAIQGEGNTLVVTDAGAIAAGERVARESLIAGAELADRSIGAVLEASRGGLDAVEASSQRSSDFARGIFESSLSAVRGVVQESQATLGSTVTALNTIAREQSTSTDERVLQAMKVGALLVAAVVAAFALRGVRA